jgi:HSP20 family protein
MEVTCRDWRRRCEISPQDTRNPDEDCVRRLKMKYEATRKIKNTLGMPPIVDVRLCVIVSHVQKGSRIFPTFLRTSSRNTIFILPSRHLRIVVSRHFVCVYINHSSFTLNSPSEHQDTRTQSKYMQTIRNNFHRLPSQLSRINKPTSTTTRPYHSTPAKMSLFPRFTQEFSPLFRLLDDYERHALRSVPAIQTFSPKFDVKEHKDAYELHGEFPGVEQKDINIEWTDANTLTITGKHETVREEGTRPSQAIEGQEPAKAIEGQKNGDKAHQPTVEDESAEKTNETTGSESQVAKQSQQQEVTKKADNEPKYWVSERSVGSFHRSFNFPTRVDQDAVKASLKNGILSVIVPKAKKETPRKVNIE